MTKKKIGVIVKENIDAYLKILREKKLVPCSRRDGAYSMSSKTLYALLEGWERMGLIEVDRSRKNNHITATPLGEHYANVLSNSKEEITGFFLSVYK